MTERKTAALRLISIEPLAASGVAATAPAPDATDDASDRKSVARGPATTSPIRRWRWAPRPAAWQPSTWGDAL